MATAKFLIRDTSEYESESAAYAHALSLLVQGIELHTLDLDGEEYKQFRATLVAAQEKLVGRTPLPELFTQVGQVIENFAQYNRRASAKLCSQAQELRSHIANLHGELANMMSASYAALSRLREFQEHLADVEMMDDLRAPKNELTAFLKSMAADVDAHKKKSASIMTALSDGAKAIQTAVGKRSAHAEVDPVTGLPGREAAELALAEALESGDQTMAAVFVMTCFKQLNGKYGYEAISNLVAWLATYLGSGAGPDGGIFRWNGPALLALFGSSVPVVRVRQKIRDLIGEMPTREITIGLRTVAIPLSVGWTVFPVCHPLERFFRQMDAFVQGQCSEDQYDSD